MYIYIYIYIYIHIYSERERDMIALFCQGLPQICFANV